ncbi:MAG: hypothetical protein GY822_25820 [Deltaproteobacteria bacterium]|nr:hypothetical protein [Deltaproteobacteria bacterium]
MADKKNLAGEFAFAYVERRTRSNDGMRTDDKVLADIHQLENALLNLVLDAKDAIVGVGSIQIKAEDVEVRADSREAESVPLGMYCRLSVVDSGSGMPEEHISRVFEPFFTTKKRARGLGSA